MTCELFACRDEAARYLISDATTIRIVGLCDDCVEVIRRIAIAVSPSASIVAVNTAEN